MSSVAISTTANGTTIEKTSNATINISHIQVTPMFLVAVHVDPSKPQHGQLVTVLQLFDLATWIFQLDNITKNLYQVLLSLSKAACSHCPMQAKTLVSTPKQNVLILILLQHIYGYE